MIGLEWNSPRPADFGDDSSANVAGSAVQPGSGCCQLIRFSQVCAINCGGSL
jgi:hypothetical protein